MAHDEFLECEELESEEKDGFQITDDGKAEWALKKILAAKRERERLLALIDSEKQELERKKEEIERKYDTDTAFLKFKLSEYFRTVEHKKTKTQETYQLLSGVLVYKMPKPKLTPDDEKLLAWCKANAPEFITTTEKVSWRDVKSKLAIVGDTVIFQDTGEFLDCVSVDETAGEFDVK